MSDTQWHGEPCTARRITAIVTDTGAFPAYWARDFAGTRRTAVEVTYAGGTFYIDDEGGFGWAKVTSGGSPHLPHSSLTIDPATDGQEPEPHATSNMVAERVTAALIAEWHRRAQAGIVASPEEHSAAMARVALDALPDWLLRGTQDSGTPGAGAGPAEESALVARRECIAAGLDALLGQGLTQPEAMMLKQHVRAELYDADLTRAVLADHRVEGEALRARILDIDAHATPIGLADPDDPDGNPHHYAVTVGALHRALGKVGHTAAPCTAEATIERVRKLHRPLDYHGMIICGECSALSPDGRSTDNMPVLHARCATFAALAPSQPEQVTGR